MALARFYLAHQFAQEALGLMKLALWKKSRPLRKTAPST